MPITACMRTPGGNTLKTCRDNVIKSIHNGALREAIDWIKEMYNSGNYARQMAILLIEDMYFGTELGEVCPLFYKPVEDLDHILDMVKSLVTLRSKYPEIVLPEPPNGSVDEMSAEYKRCLCEKDRAGLYRCASYFHNYRGRTGCRFRTGDEILWILCCNQRLRDVNSTAAYLYDIHHDPTRWRKLSGTMIVVHMSLLLFLDIKCDASWVDSE